jgi:Fe-S cluster assembly protein SufD
MTIESTTDQELFHQRLTSLWDKHADNDLLAKMRQSAWNRYLEIGLPTRDTEVFRYIPLRKLFAGHYQPANKVESTPKTAALVFTNGHFRPDLSAPNEKIVVLPLAEAMKTYSTLLHNQWNQELNKEKDPFAALNAALHTDGLFIYIPPKVRLEKPIEIHHIIDADDYSLIQPRIHLFAGKQAEATLIRTQHFIRGRHLAINGAISIALDEAAHLHYDTSNLEEPEDTWHLEAFRATQKRDSRLKTVEVTDGTETIRHDYRVHLNGENSEVLLNGVWMLAEKRQAHTHIIVEHVAPHCRSYQLFKSALTEAARSSFEGKIYVHPEAQKTEAYQLNNNLLLSDRAMADSKPNLEIFADDVKASHGSTVGQLDAEELFYLRTRGLSDHDARNILIYGFCKEVIDLIEIPELKAEVTKRAQRFLTQG